MRELMRSDVCDHFSSAGIRIFGEVLIAYFAGDLPSPVTRAPDSRTRLHRMVLRVRSCCHQIHEAIVQGELFLKVSCSKNFMEYSSVGSGSNRAWERFLNTFNVCEMRFRSEECLAVET